MINTLKNALKKVNNIDLNKDEIIVTSIVIGTLLAILLGYVFGETQYLDIDGTRIYADITRIKKLYPYTPFYSSYAFNYFIGTASLIIGSGISFLYLSKNKTNVEQQVVDNAKVDGVKENIDKFKVVVKDNLIVSDSLKGENINPFMNLKTVIPTAEYEEVIEIMIKNIKTNRANLKKHGCFLIDYDFENYLYQSFIGENDFVTTYTAYYLVHEAWNRVGENTLSLIDAQHLYKRLFGERTGNLLSDIHITLPISSPMQ